MLFFTITIIYCSDTDLSIGVALQASRQRNSSSEGDTQVPERRYSGSWEEIFRLLDLET